MPNLFNHIELLGSCSIKLLILIKSILKIAFYFVFLKYFYKVFYFGIFKILCVMIFIDIFKMLLKIILLTSVIKQLIILNNNFTKQFIMLNNNCY